jgi:hypothetical protein
VNQRNEPAKRNRHRSQVLINALTGKVGSGTQVTGYPTNQRFGLGDEVDSLELTEHAPEILSDFRFSPIRWDLWGSNSCKHLPHFIFRHFAQYRWLESVHALRTLGTYRESVLSSTDIGGPILRMAVGSPFSKCVHALDLDPSFGNPCICLCCHSAPEPSRVNIDAARIDSREAFILLWLELSATRPLHRPIAGYNAVLCVCRLFCRGLTRTISTYESTARP